MKNIQEKRKILNDLLNLYDQYGFVKNDTAGKKSISAMEQVQTRLEQLKK